MSAAPEINGFFDDATNSVSYLVADPESREAAVIDPVLDFDPASGTIATKSADEILASAKERGLQIAWVLETHVHADHLSAAAEIRRRTGAKIAIGAGVRDVQALFGPIFGAKDIAPDGDDFDQLLNDGDTISLGELIIE